MATTLYLNLRGQSRSGSVLDRGYYRADPEAAAIALTPVTNVGASGRNVLFAAHGFNVDQENGVRSLGRLEAYLRQLGKLEASDLFVGVLWPGDFWIPVIDYPFEGAVAIQAGKALATRANTDFKSASSLSFASHSLGARVILQALSGLDGQAAALNRRIRAVCLTAGAINRSCLQEEYREASQNAAAISFLASVNDLVLMVAFSVADPISDILHPDHRPLEAALGSYGPTSAAPPNRSPWQIGNDADYGHGDYFPPSGMPGPAGDPPDARWRQSVRFIGNAYRGEPLILPVAP
ncbi:MAG TPA: alpha/beta hydrolase [Methylocystis sp.]|nr:alpha/beta hydrolase [Methylocystis sp.]